MLKIRGTQMAALSQQALAALQRELTALVRERFPLTCTALGGQATEKLVAICIETCRAHVAPNRVGIAMAVESLFGTEGVEMMSPDDAARAVRAELDARRLYSLMETLAGAEAS